jgi:quercetin dioxygenase-like cupin family protein
MAILPPTEVLPLASLVTPKAHGVASHVLARSAAGNITLFAFDAGEEMGEHTVPFDVLVLTLEGELILVIDDREIRTAPQTVVLVPGHVPYAVRADAAARMLLIALRDSPAS